MPLRDRAFEISQETSVSGETMYVFVADFFPGRSIVYVFSDQPVESFDGEVLIIYLRPYVRRRL